MSDTDGWWASDLILVVFATNLVAAGIYLGDGGSIRLLLTVPLVLFLPGYALTAAVFPAAHNPTSTLPSFDEDVGGIRTGLPSNYEIDEVERFALTVVLSPVVVAAVAVASNASPWGITLLPILGGVTALTMLFALVATIRRLLLPSESRFRPSLSKAVGIPVPFRPTQGPLHSDTPRLTSYNLASTLALLVVLASVLYAVGFPPPTEQFTEFYVVTDDVNGQSTSTYPSQLTVGETAPVEVAISNHEEREMRYTVVTALRDTPPDADEPIPPDEMLSTQTVTVERDDTRNLTLDVEADRTGEDRRLVVLLYRDDPPAEPTVGSAYRVLTLRVDVTERGTASRHAAPLSADDRRAVTGGLAV